MSGNILCLRFWVEVKWVEGFKFKDHNSVSKRTMSPWRSRNYRWSEREELSLESSLCKSESLSLRKVWTGKKSFHWACCSTFPGKVPFSLWFPGDPSKSTGCPRVREGPAFLLFTSLHGRKPQRGGNTNCVFIPALWIVRDLGSAHMGKLLFPSPQTSSICC